MLKGLAEDVVVPAIVVKDRVNPIRVTDADGVVLIEKAGTVIEVFPGDLGSLIDALIKADWEYTKTRFSGTYKFD